jgi:phosphopantothenoylcysteine synthetase/decarboxylase
VANDVSNGQVFNDDSNKVIILSNRGSSSAEGTKDFVASAILDFLSPEIQNRV